MSLPPPFAEDLVLDVPLPAAPEVTLDAGLAAVYLAVTGDPLPLALSGPLARAVTGGPTPLVNPALALSVAIGQSTVATRRVIANLLYRDVRLDRQLHVGETLRTVVTPRAAAWTRSGTERAKVLLEMAVTADGEPVARFQRVALLPVREPSRLVERAIPEAAPRPALADFAGVVPDWDVAGFPTRLGARPGDVLVDPLADTVSAARELARLTLNAAAAHRDGRAGLDGRRLVYGGHTIGLAQASLARQLDGLLTVLAWRSCDHVAPVFEDDLLVTSVEVLDVHRLGAGLALVDARVLVDAHRDGAAARVLDWHPVLLAAADPEGTR